MSLSRKFPRPLAHRLKRILSAPGGTMIPAPVNLTPPVIAGTAIAGETLTATPGTWGGTALITGQWYLDGLPVYGQTGLTYDTTAVGEVTYLETALNAAGRVDVESNVITLAQFDLAAMIIGAGGSFWTPHDKTTLFQDTAGTTPVTAAGQTVKRISDVSGRGWHLTNATGDLYQEDANGIGYVALSGTTGAAWTTTASTAAFKFLHDGTGGSVITLVEKDADSATRTLVNTGNTPGFALTINLAGLPITTIRNAVPANVAVLTNPQCFPFGPGGRRVHAITFSSATGLDLHADGVAVPYNGSAQIATPSTANSSANFSIGATFKGKFVFMAALPGVLAAAQQRGSQSALAAYQRPVPAWDRPFVDCGQSNDEASGIVTSAVTMPNFASAMYDRSDRFRHASTPIHDRTNWIPTAQAGGSQRSGYQLPMANHISDDTDTVPLLVPCGIGGTSMTLWMPAEDRFDRSTLYGSMNARTQAVLAINPASEVPVFVWFGHEQDHNMTSENFAIGEFGVGYLEYWHLLMVGELRQDYPDSPIIYAQVSSRNTANAPQGRVQESQRQGEASFGSEYSVPNSFMVVTFDVARNASPDDVHVSEAGHKVVGQRFALAYREHVLGEPVNGTGPRLVAVTLDAADTVRVKYDKTVNASATDYGDLHRVYDDGVEATVSSAVRDAGDDTSILLTLSAPTAGLVCVTYGERDTPDATALTDIVKDSDGMPAPTFRVYDIQPT